MSGDITGWNYGLLFASLCVTLGIIGFVSVQCSDNRRFASGVILQGTVVMFLAGSSYFHSSGDLQLGALTVTGLLIIQSLFGQSLFGQSFLGKGTNANERPLEKSDQQ